MPLSYTVPRIQLLKELSDCQPTKIRAARVLLDITGSFSLLRRVAKTLITSLQTTVNIRKKEVPLGSDIINKRVVFASLYTKCSRYGGT